MVRARRPASFSSGTPSHVVDSFWGPIEDVRQKAVRAYRSPLWKALLSPAKWPDSPRKRAGGPVKRTAKTVKWYKVSMRALQDAVRVCQLEQNELEAIASVKDETLFLALRQLRRRGVSYDQAMVWATATEEEREEMGAQDFRVGDASLEALTHCTPKLVKALRNLGERVPRLSTVKAVFDARMKADAAQPTSAKKASTQAKQEEKEKKPSP